MAFTMTDAQARINQELTERLESIKLATVTLLDIESMGASSLREKLSAFRCVLAAQNQDVLDVYANAIAALDALGE